MSAGRGVSCVLGVCARLSSSHSCVVFSQLEVCCVNALFRLVFLGADDACHSAATHQTHYGWEW